VPAGMEISTEKRVSDRRTARERRNNPVDARFSNMADICERISWPRNPGELPPGVAVAIGTHD